VAEAHNGRDHCSACGRSRETELLS
jgi:hypothetical protein